MAKTVAKKMTVKEIAKRIDAYLKRFEKDPAINTYGSAGTKEQRDGNLHPYYHAGAWDSGRYVRVVYIAYQGSSAITKDEAGRYLAKLDDGFIGRHHEALRGER